MRYTLVKTDRAFESMRNILHFISYHFDAGTALRKVDELEKGMNLLSENPYMGSKPRDRVLRREGYRVLTMEKNIVFYKVDEAKQAIVIYFVADQRQDYIRLLKD